MLDSNTPRINTTFITLTNNHIVKDTFRSQVIIASYIIKKIIE